MKRPQGTGTIERTPDGRYRPRLPRRYGRQYLDVCDTEGEAAALLAVALEEEPPDELTLAEWGETWIDHRQEQGYRSTAHERRRWRRLVADTALGTSPLTRVTRLDVQRWLDSLPGARKTRVNALGLVRGALRHAQRERKLKDDPSVGVLLPPGRSQPAWTWLRQDEIAALLLASDGPKQRSILTAAVYTGARAGELWALRWQDVDESEGVIHIRHAVTEDGQIGETKSGRPREVALLHPVQRALAAWRPHCPDRNRFGLVWPGRYGGPHPRGHTADLSSALDRAGVRRVRFHDLRHTCASHLIQGTWAPHVVARALRLEEVQQWLGHSTRTMTERYAHLAPDGLRGLRVAYEASESAGGGGDPKGIRTPASGAPGPVPGQMSAEIGHAVGQVTEAVRRAIVEGPPEHAWTRVLEALVEAERRYPVPALRGGVVEGGENGQR